MNTSLEYEPSKAALPADSPGAERLKLFMMINTFETGGSERQFVAITSAIRPDRFDVLLGCIGRRGALFDHRKEVAEFPLGGSFLSARAQFSRIALGRYLRRHKVDVAHSFDFYTNLLLLPTARLAGVPVLIGSHRQLGDLLTGLQLRCQALAFRFCDRVVCNSEAAGRRLQAQGIPERKIAIIPNGLRPEIFAAASPLVPLSHGILRIGMIARMNARSKNHALLLRAAARLTAKLPNLEFLLAGDGPLRPELETLACKLGIKHCVSFLGDRQDIPAVLASLDISVVPSSSESLSNTIVESMAAGVPVVATDVGGTPEIISDGQTGLLVRSGHEDELAGAIGRFVAQPSLRAACARKAKEVALSRFSLRSVADLYEQLYQDVLASKKGRTEDFRERSSRVSAAARPLRVAIVGPSHRYVGGQSVQVDMLLRSWRGDQGVEVDFIAADPELPSFLKWARGIPMLRTLLRQPFYCANLWRRFKDIDIAHVFSASYWSFLLAPATAYWIARARKRKVLIHYHSGEALDHLRRSWVARRILKRADCVVVPSKYLVEVFGKFNLTVKPVANVVDINQFAFRPRIPLRPRLICSRGFHPYYGLEDVVRAFSVIRNKHSDAVLCLLGTGPNEQKIRELVESLRLCGVEFTGAVPHHEIANYYERADIFINASRLDNMPVSILEAFASGLPVVTTSAGGISHFVEHQRTGLLCEPGDWKSLAECVLRLLKEPELARRLAENAYHESKQYSWAAVRRHWLQLYRSL